MAHRRVAKQHRLVPCRAYRCRALPQWEAAPGSPDETWAMHVPKKKHSHMGMDQYLLIPFLGGWTSILTQLFWCEQKGYKGARHTAINLRWYRWCLHDCWMCWNELNSIWETSWFGSLWRIAAIMCDEYSVSPNSMERWKPYSSTLFTHFVLG